MYEIENINKFMNNILNDKKTNFMGGNLKTILDKVFSGGNASSDTLTPLNNMNTLQFYVTIFIIVITSLVVLIGVGNAIRSDSASLTKVMIFIFIIQVLCLLTITLLYCFDVNSNSLYNILKLVLILFINLMFIINNCDSNIANYFAITAILVILIPTYLFIIISSFTDIPIDATSEFNTPLWKQIMFRGMPLILIGVLIITKLICLLGPDQFKCIEFYSLKTSTPSTLKTSTPSTLGGRKRRQ